MAAFIKNDEQLKALDDVKTMLGQISVINQLIADPNAEFTVSVGKKADIPLLPSFNEKILAMLKSQRERIIRDINAKATKFAIGLDESDMAIINGAVPAGKERKHRNPRKPA